MLEGWENGGFFKRDARDKGVQHAEYVALKAKLHYGLHKDRTQRRVVKNDLSWTGRRETSHVSFRRLLFKSPSA